MNIVIIGYRGAGKTAVGRYVSRKLKRKFIDTDEYIEDKTHLSIKEIFEISGQAYFRDLETAVISELSKQNGIVIATGGGAVLRYKNTQKLKRNGLVFFLDVDSKSAYERVIRDPETAKKRPHMTDASLMVEIKQQIVSRHPYYMRAADYRIPTMDTMIEDIAEQIIRHISEQEDTTHIGL